MCWNDHPSSITTASPPAPIRPATSSCISNDLPDPDLPVTQTRTPTLPRRQTWSCRAPSSSTIRRRVSAFRAERFLKGIESRYLALASTGHVSYKLTVNLPTMAAA